MIISYKYQFIFIKTGKTAGSSIENFLSNHCGEQDIITPMVNEQRYSLARNWKPFVIKDMEYRLAQADLPGKERKAIQQALKYLSTHSLPQNIDIQNDPQWAVTRYILDRYSHLTARKCRQAIGPALFDKFFVFCVERNPWDKNVSMYFWNQYCNRRDGWSNKNFLSLLEKVKHRIINRHHYTPRHKNFSEFLAKATHRASHWDYYTDANGKVMVDRILRYENLDEELTQCCQQLGIPFDDWKTSEKLKTTQRPEKGNYEKFYTPEQRQQIAEQCANEIALMGYTFGA